MIEVVGNIVLVGETGAGKSSIINMIAGVDIAETSNGAASCTFDHHDYTLPVHDQYFKIFDTMGLNEGDRGTVGHTAAIAKLYQFITHLDGQINLLVFCMRGPRIKDATHQNWKLFHEIMCEKKVPTVLVVTGLENEDSLDSWWWNNKENFERHDIRPDDTACITAIRGKKLGDDRYAFDDQYEESRAKVMKLILNRALLSAPRFHKTHWFYALIRPILTFFRLTKIRHRKVVRDIAAVCGLSEEETRRLREEFDKH